ncbi:ChbG/HpnK family deacetylase [Klebsiella variicola]|nr:ChbG/HpnK family deacetylase [Klebsiella variicola]
MACQYRRFVDLFGHEPTHLDSHHHVHMIAPISSHRGGLCPREGYRVTY